MRQPAPAFTSLERTRRFIKAVETLQQSQRKQLQKQLAQLVQDPAHPSLKAHQIKPDKHYWAAYLNRGDRIIYIPEGSHLVMVDIVPHDRISSYGKRRKPLQTPRSAPPRPKKKR